jgi:hypothetical protein
MSGSDRSVSHAGPSLDALDRLIPAPRLLEIDRVDLAADPERVWQTVRHGDLAQSPLARALFALRTLPERLSGKHVDNAIRLDDMRSTAEHPGFQILVDDPPYEVAAGAIGAVWVPEIPFVHVADAEAFAAYAEPGVVKVAWALRITRPAMGNTRLELELRVDVTDEASWPKFRNYFRIIGPASRFIRRSLLAGVAHELDKGGAHENQMPLPGDEFLPDAVAQLTDAITIHARPERIWPWLIQMGSRRAGYYSIDLLDNAGRPSAREIHPELQRLEVGDVIPASPGSDDGFEVLRIDEPHTLVLGGLFDAAARKQLPFSTPRPERFWHVTWTFALDPIELESTRVRARVRVAFPASGRFHAAWIGPAHRLMERAQLRNLAARVEGREETEDWRDAFEGIGGAAAILFALLTPHLRDKRSHWGLTAEEAARAYPGDDLVADPEWSWTHAVEIEAPAPVVWPWVAQIGADRAGFYSYQWLENLAGADLVNAERIHPEWQVCKGDELVVHRQLPPLVVDRVEPGHWFVAHAASPVVSVTWLFLVEPMGERHCRLVSRYRCRTKSEEFAAHAVFGPWISEPLGFAMDRRMLLGIKTRAERTVRERRSIREPV